MIDFSKADPTFVRMLNKLKTNILANNDTATLNSLILKELINTHNYALVASDLIKIHSPTTLAYACFHEYVMRLASYTDSKEQAFDEAIESIIYLHIAKNGDYSAHGGNDRWANIRACEYIGIPAQTGIIVRVLDKINRYISLTRLPELPRVRESLEDTLIDIVSYLVIYHCLDDELSWWQ